MKRFLLKKIYNRAVSGFSKPASVRNIVVLREDSLGDLVLMLPFLKAIEHFLPQSKTIVLTRKPFVPVINDIFTNVLAEPLPNKSIIGKYAYLKKRFKKVDVDLLIDPFYRRVTQSPMYYRAVRPQFVAGFEKSPKYGLDKNDFNLDLTTPIKHESTLFHHYQELLQLILDRFIGEEEYRSFFNVELPRQEKIEAYIPLKLNCSWLLFNIEGNAECRKMSPDLVYEICQKVMSLNIVDRIFVTGTHSYIENVKQSLSEKPVLDAVVWNDLNTSVLEMFTLTKNADAILSVDTSIVHIASIYNKPIVGVYLDNSVGKLFYPYTEKYFIVKAPCLSQISCEQKLDLSAKVVDSLIKVLGKDVNAAMS